MCAQNSRDNHIRIGNVGANGRTPARTQEEVNRRINELSGRVSQVANEYRAELNRLRSSTNASIREANQTIQNNHRHELRIITERYENAHREMNAEIARSREQFNRALMESNELLMGKLRNLEERIEQRSSKDKAFADERIRRMREAWHALRERTELGPFIETHVPTINQTNEVVDKAYRLEQYQAISAIMVNCSALIDNWEREAETMYKDWCEMRELCQDVIDYMRDALDAAHRTVIDCDGTLNRDINLFRYDENGFAEVCSILRNDEDRIENANGLTIEGMRNFLHTLETDRLRIDGTIERATLQHRAFLRRLKAYKALSDGLVTIHYSKQKAEYSDGDILSDIVILFKQVYTGDKLHVTIKTPNYNYPSTAVSLTFIPGAVMDTQSQETQCGSLSGFASALIEGNEINKPQMTRVRPYKNLSGHYQAEVGVNYQA